MFLDCTLQQSASWIHRSAWKSWPPPSNLSKEWSRNVRAQGIDMFTGVIDYWFGGYWYWMVLDDCTRDHCSVIRYAIVGIKLHESSWKNNKSTRMNSVTHVAFCVALFSSQVGHSRHFFGRREVMHIFYLNMLLTHINTAYWTPENIENCTLWSQISSIEMFPVVSGKSVILIETTTFGYSIFYKLHVVPCWVTNINMMMLSFAETRFVQIL